MMEIKKGPKRMNHHSWTTAFSYRAKKHENEGDPASFVRAFKDAYARDDLGGPYVEKMIEHVSKLVEERRDKYPDIAPEDPLPIESQISVIVNEVGKKRGTDIRGVGRCMQWEPKKKEGAWRIEVETLVEERVSQIKKAWMTQYKEEAVQAVCIRQMEETIAQILA